MIFTDRKITIRNGKSSINEPVILYRGDYEVSIKFTIMESKFRFKSGVNLVDSEKASHGQLAILAPYGGNVFSEIVKCEDGTVTFTLTKEMIDQLEEVGLYSFQIRLFDYYRESRVSIPPVEFGIEVREPVASEDHDNEVNNAIVGYSIAKVVDGLNEDVPDTFDANGQYNKTNWKTGDRISQGKLNKIEDALDKINQNEKNDAAALDKRVTNNFNVLSNELDTKVGRNDKISVNMIDKNKGKIDQTYLSDELIDQIAGDAAVNAVPADNSITNNKLTIDCVQAFNTTFIEGHAGEWFDGYSLASFGSEEPMSPNSKGTVLHMVDVGTALGKWRFLELERVAFLDNSGKVLGVFAAELDHTVMIDETNTSYYNLFKNATYMSVSTSITRKSGVHIYHNDEEIQFGYTIKYLDLNERQLEQCDVNTNNFLKDKLGYKVMGGYDLGYWYSPTQTNVLAENAEYFTTVSLDAKYGDTVQIPLIPNMHHRINVFDKNDNILGGWSVNSISTTNSMSITHELFIDCMYIKVSAPIVGIDNFYVKINDVDVLSKESSFSFDKMASTFNEDIEDYMTANLGYRTTTKNHIGYCYPSNSLDVMVPFENYFTTSFIPAAYGDTVKVPYSNTYVRINVFDHGQKYLGGYTFNSTTTAAGEDHTLEITHTAYEKCGYVTVSARLSQYSGYYVLVNGEDRFDGNEYFVFDKMLDGNSGNSGNNIIEPGDITSVLGRGGHIKLVEGVYTSKNVTLPANTILEGIGNNTIIKFDDTCTGDMLTLSNGCKINNIVLDGGITAQPSYTDTIGDRNGIRINNVVRCRLHEVRVTGFSGNGLRATTIGANQEHHKNLKISNCDFEFNYIGMLFDTRAEYIQTINTACGNNFWGCVNRGGNNLFSNCMFNSNYNGFMVEGGSAYANHGHSSSSNCSYNHNNNIGIQALNVTIGYIFNGCQLFDGDLIIENSTGIWFCNGEMGSHSININGGGFNLIKDNFFYTKPTVTTTESNSLLKDNYYADGTSFTNN